MSMRCPVCVIAFATLLIGGCLDSLRPASAASLARQLETIFTPLRVEHASLARDGRHVAFGVRDDAELQIVVYDLDAAGDHARLRIDAPADARFSHLEWVAPDRLVAALNDAAVLVVSAAGELVQRLEKPAAFAPAGESRRGRPAVRVLGPAEQADCVALEVQWQTGGSEVRVEVLNLNARTGERHVAASREVGPSGGRFLLDRQGRARLLFSAAGASVSRQFLHRPAAGGDSDWQALDRLGRDLPASAWRVTPQNHIGERAFPLGFDGDPAVLYFASNLGRDTYGIYALDVRTGATTGFAIEDPARDLADFRSPFPRNGLRFDRASNALAGFAGPTEMQWFDPGLAGVQDELAAQFPAREIEILEWDDARQRFLVRVTAPIDAGRYFVYHRADGRAVEYQRNPALAADDASRTEAFACITTDGVSLSGAITWPRAGSARGRPALVAWFHDGPLDQTATEGSREAQALAAVGLAVVQLDYRGSAGFGRRHREQIRTAFDRVPLDDAVAAVEALAAQGRIDRSRVTAAGIGFGGYLALRARQLRPDVFGGAAAIQATLELAQHRLGDSADPVGGRGAEGLLRERGVGLRDEGSAPSNDLGPADRGAGATEFPALASRDDPPASFEREFERWYFAPAGRQDTRVMSDLDRLAGPLLFLYDPRLPRPSESQVRRLREGLARRKQSVEFVELPPAFALGATEARAAIFREMGEFLATCRLPSAPAAGAAATAP